jgi:hypothetical protein
LSFLEIAELATLEQSQLLFIPYCFLPVFVWVFEEAHQMNVIEQVNFAKTNQIRECPLTFELL